MQGLITIKSIGDNDMKKTVVRTKRLMILAMMMVMIISANAMSYNAAKNEALFLSDKGTTRLTSVLGWVPGLRAQLYRCTV